MTKEGNPNIVSIPVHKGRTIKIGLLKDQIKKSGLTEEEFLTLIYAPKRDVSGQEKGMNGIGNRKYLITYA